ncbi:MAG: hypothetical protein AAB373_03555 [Patescibacteria group bacterium]
MPHSYKDRDDEGIIDLRNNKDEPEFKINHVHDQHEAVVTKVFPRDAAPLSEMENAAMQPYDKVKVKFDKFVNLVATHAYQEIFDKHQDEDVIISTDLLADLANAHEEKDDGKKVPMVFVVGIVLGIALTWIILKM